MNVQGVGWVSRNELLQSLRNANDSFGLIYHVEREILRACERDEPWLWHDVNEAIAWERTATRVAVLSQDEQENDPDWWSCDSPSL